MPLQDHFHAPLSQSHPWRGFSSAWAAAIARLLNRGVLPEGYYAIPNVELDGPVEIDVATLQEKREFDANGNGSEMQLWTPPKPNLVATLDFPAVDLVEVQVMYDEDGPRLMAAVELVSLSNRDRPSERRAFAVKCATYLHQGSSVVIVDTVTTRRANLHRELVCLLDMEESASWESETQLYAAAYRNVEIEEQRELQAWTESLTLGATLPSLQLWLGVDVCVELDLEASYQATCEDLRVRQAS